MIKKQKFILTIRFFTYGKFGLIFIYANCKMKLATLSQAKNI